MLKKMINGREYLLREYDVADIDKLAIRMMEENQIDGLLSFRNVQNPEESYFRYDCRMGNTLDDWLLMVHTKNEVLHLLESMLTVCDEVEAYLMDKNGLWTTTDGIIVENDTAYMAYIPDISYRNGDILELIQVILPRVKFARDEKYTYIFDLMNAFSRNEITNAIELKKWLRVFHSNTEDIKEEYSYSQEMENQSAVLEVSIPVNENNSDKSGFLKKSEKAIKKVEKEKASVSDGDLFENFLGGASGIKSVPEKKKEKKSGGFFNRKKTDEMSVQMSIPEKEIRTPLSVRENVINEIEYTDKTVIMEAEEAAYLVRTKTNEEFRLGKRDCEIGRGNTADILISGNPAIARRQARIYVEDGSYYITDEGSSNGTCLDGVRLQAGQPYRLGHFSRIQFADENFIFELRS